VAGLAASHEEPRECIRDDRAIALRALRIEMPQRLADTSPGIDGPGQLEWRSLTAPV